MGLSIHYKGKFKKEASLSELIDEVKDIAMIYEWRHHIFETEFDLNQLGKDSYNQNIFGITFSPPKCEPINFTFLSNGIMCDPLHLKYCKDINDENEYSFTISSKTQYAGVEIHKIIIDLFRYLDKKFFQEFNLTDESSYWETGNENVLRQNFKRYVDLMNQFVEGLDNIPIKENETMESYIERVTKLIHESRKKH